ncbi:cell division protein Fic [Desulfocarbo indianensis]|nr:cell division protein Fic [Desulfocarbo indianensis]
MDFHFEDAVRYHYGKFPPASLDLEQLLDPLLKATDAVARYDQMLKTMHNSEILLAPLRNQEAVISSRIEGTISTMDEILKYEADHDAEKGTAVSTRSEIIETYLYTRALKAAQKAMEEGYLLTQSLIKTIHQSLLSFGRGSLKSPGKFKTEQNYLADKSSKSISFIPISPEKLRDGMDSLFNYMKQSGHPPLLKTAVTHIEFEALHPFKDGNGRIGRILITLMLWSSGIISSPHFYVSGYLEDNKNEYIERMRDVSRSGDWDGWCAFFLKAVERQAVNNLALAESIRDLYKEMKQRFAGILASKWSVNALDFIFGNPVFRNNRFTKNSGIPSATAARITRVLLEHDLIKTVEEASGRRPALYSFEPLLELVRV